MDCGASPEERLAALGLELPPPPRPSGLYRPIAVVGAFVLTSGHAPVRLDGSRHTGRLGEDLSVEQGQEAARACALGILASLKAALGTLDPIQRVAQVRGMVNASADFTQHPAVLDGCSEVFQAVFGPENGVGVRSVMGVASLPGNTACQIEAVFVLKEAFSG